MTTSTESCVPSESGPVAPQEVERELTRRLKAIQPQGKAPVMRACLSNLVIFTTRPEQAQEIADQVPAIIALHPARVLLLIGQRETGAGDLTASVCVRPHPVGSGRTIYSEQVTLRADGQAVDRLPYVVRTLLIGDLPVNLWWAIHEPPPLAGQWLDDLAEHAQQIIYDSIGWLEPARGVVATAAWVQQMLRTTHPGQWRVASDLNWRRLKYWRRLLAQALDPAAAPGALDSVTEVLVEHGPHAVIQAWELVGWLAGSLGWRVEAGRVQPGVEISWQCRAAHGTARVRLRRLPDGPSEIRRVRIACQLDGKPAALAGVVESEHRLAIMPEGVEGVVPRTVTIHPQPLAALVGNQLSDREHDPAFLESMAVGEVLARSVLGE